MSTEAMAWAWKQAETCGDKGTHLVLLALAEHSDPDGLCWPSRKRIADYVGYDTPGSVTKKIAKIEGLGLMERIPQFDPTKSGRQKNNLYRLQLGPLVEMEQPPGGTSEGGPLLQTDEPRTVSKEPSEGNSQGGQLFAVPDPSPAPDDDGMADVQRVWDEYVEVFDPPRAKLGPNRIKGIKRALQEAPADTLVAAVHGLYEFRKGRPGKTSLETIWETFRGTGTMIERIEFFAAKSDRPGGVQQFPSAPAAIVSEKQKDVQRGHRNPDNEELVGRAEGSEAWLREHGIETYRREGDGYPLFRPLTSGATPDGGDAA